MRFVVVSTVPDEGAAEVAREALGDRGIEVELRRQGMQNPYVPSAVSAHVYEVRVPEEQAEAAEAVLEHLHAELEQALIAQAGAAADEHEAEAEDAPAPTPRRFGAAQTLYFGLIFAAVLLIALYVYWEGR
jgi:hypothetical protein